MFSIKRCYRAVYFRNVSTEFRTLDRLLVRARREFNLDGVVMVVNVNILTLLVILFVSSVPFVTAEQDNCIRTLSDRCTRTYEADAQGETSNQVMCTALASYLRCVEDVKKSVKSCNSNLYYHTISTLIPRLMKDRSCGNVSLPINQTALTTVRPATRSTSQPACVNFKHKQIKLAGGQVRQNAHQFRLCALFGDPHLKTFMDERQTCVVQGAWPLIDNEYFSVQVTNVPVVRGSSATATNMVRTPKLF